MATTLPGVVHEHHERIMSHVDRMPATGDLIGTAATEAVRAQLGELVTFLTGTLIPHVDTAEQTLYPELERILQNAHSMTPMRREHAQIRRQVAELGLLRDAIADRPPTTREAVALRRSVFGLYALLKVHLAEEALYLHIVEQGVTEEVSGVLAAAMEHPIAPVS